MTSLPGLINRIMHNHDPPHRAYEQSAQPWPVSLGLQTECTTITRLTGLKNWMHIPDLPNWVYMYFEEGFDQLIMDVSICTFFFSVLQTDKKC